MKILLIDDIRTAAHLPHLDPPTDIARTFKDGIDALKKGDVDVLYLDHDLGDVNPDHTGYGIMCFLEQNLNLYPSKIILITSNPVGRKNMQSVIDSVERRKNKHIDHMELLSKSLKEIRKKE